TWVPERRGSPRLERDRRVGRNVPGTELITLGRLGPFETARDACSCGCRAHGAATICVGTQVRCPTVGATLAPTAVCSPKTARNPGSFGPFPFPAPVTVSPFPFPFPAARVRARLPA